MGIGIFKSIYRAIRYGKQVGKTANNGARAYKRGRKLTGLDKDGNVITTINKYKTAPNTTRTTTKTALPNNGYKISNTTKTTDNFDGSFSLFKDTKYIDEYGIERTVYGKPEFVQINGTKGQGMQVTIDTPVLKNNTTMNMRQTFKAKY